MPCYLCSPPFSCRAIGFNFCAMSFRRSFDLARNPRNFSGNHCYQPVAWFNIHSLSTKKLEHLPFAPDLGDRVEECCSIISRLEKTQNSSQEFFRGDVETVDEPLEPASQRSVAFLCESFSYHRKDITHSSLIRRPPA